MSLNVLVKHLQGKHPQKSHAGSRGRSGILSRTKVDGITTNEQFAKQQISEYVKFFPGNLQDESSLRQLEVYENPEDATERINELEPGALESYEYARGAYSRESNIMVTSLYNSDDLYVEGIADGTYSGRNFYHEFAHSLESRIVSDGWETAFHEWDTGQDEGFAEAFSSYMVGKRSYAGGNSDELDHFKRNYPDTHTLFSKTWGW